MSFGTVALPTGPYDWHPETIPAAVYEERLAGVRAVMAQCGGGLSHVVMHGNGFDHGALCWLTGFTPKLGPAFALIPSSGVVRLLFSGGPGMKPSAERLTWVTDMTALRGLGRDLAAWLDGVPRGAGTGLGLSEGAGLTHGDWAAIGKVAGGRVEVIDAAVDALRRAKTELELRLIRQTSASLARMAEALAEALPTRSVRVAALAAERAAYGEGAQDARVLVGGGRWLSPHRVDDLDRPVAGPLCVAIAARGHGYWAAGEFVAGGGLPTGVATRAATALIGAVRAMRPGATISDIGKAAGGAARVAVVGIGLSTEEEPRLSQPGVALARGDVCNVSVKIEVEPGHEARWSVMAAVAESGPELIWMPPGLDLEGLAATA